MHLALLRAALDAIERPEIALPENSKGCRCHTNDDGRLAIHRQSAAQHFGIRAEASTPKGFTDQGYVFLFALIVVGEGATKQRLDAKQREELRGDRLSSELFRTVVRLQDRG